MEESVPGKLPWIWHAAGDCHVVSIPINYWCYTTDSPDVVNNYSRRNNKNRTIHDDHRESQLSEDCVSVENDKDLTKVKDQSHSDDVTQVTYEPDTEESLYANSAVAVSSFEGYVARKMARTKELSDDYKVLYYLDIIKSFLKDFEKLIILFLGCINCNNIAILPSYFHHLTSADVRWHSQLTINRRIVIVISMPVSYYIISIKKKLPMFKKYIYSPSFYNNLQVDLNTL